MKIAICGIHMVEYLLTGLAFIVFIVFVSCSFLFGICNLKTFKYLKT